MTGQSKCDFIEKTKVQESRRPGKGLFLDLFDIKIENMFTINGQWASFLEVIRSYHLALWKRQWNIRNIEFEQQQVNGRFIIDILMMIFLDLLNKERN